MSHTQPECSTVAPRPHFFHTATKKEPLPILVRYTAVFIATIAMADEPIASRVRVSDAHDDNGGSREPPCDSPIDDHGDATPSGNRNFMYEALLV